MPQTTWPLSPVYDLPLNQCSYSTFPHCQEYVRHTEPYSISSFWFGNGDNNDSTRTKAKDQTQGKSGIKPVLLGSQSESGTDFDDVDPILSLLARTSAILSTISLREKGEPQITTAPKHRLRKARDLITSRRVIPLVTIMLIVITFTYLAFRAQPNLGLGLGSGSYTGSKVNAVESERTVRFGKSVYVSLDDEEWKSVGPTEVPNGILE